MSAPAILDTSIFVAIEQSRQLAAGLPNSALQLLEKSAGAVDRQLWCQDEQVTIAGDQNRGARPSQLYEVVIARITGDGIRALRAGED